MRRFGGRATASVLLWLAAAGALGQEPDRPPAAAQPRAAETEEGAPAAALRPGDEIRVDFAQAPVRSDGPYRVEPADQLRVVIAGATEVIGEDVTVMPDGLIAVDPVGPVTAAGRTVVELADQLTAALSKTGMRQPRVTVSVVEPHGGVRSFLDGLERGADRATLRLQVYPDADLHLPALAPLRAPETLEALRRDLVEAYEERFGPGLLVTVNFSERVAPVIYVTGEVRAPGPYAWSEELTPLLAIAQAGGFTETSDLGSVLVIRGGGEEAEVDALDFSGLYSGGSLPAGLELSVNDVVMVPSTPTFR